MKNYFKGQNMLKQTLLTALILGSTSQLSASLCTSYGGDLNMDDESSFFFVI